MKVTKTNETKTDSDIIKNLMDKRDKHQAIVDALNKEIRKLVYSYDRIDYAKKPKS